MTDSTLEKKWMRWYPQKILLKDQRNKKKFLHCLHTLTKSDFFIDINEKKINSTKVDKPLEKIDLTITKEYKIGFEKGFLQASEENILLKNKLNSFLLDFEKSFSSFQKTLYSRLLKTVLIVSSYVIGKKTDVDQLILIQHIKKIINQDEFFLKKPCLVIHSNNKTLIQKTFKDFLQTYQWKLICDDNIELNSFKIKSENSDIEATIDSRWQELTRLIDSEE